jgi:CRP-like cAMP-binding protein
MYRSLRSPHLNQLLSQGRLLQFKKNEVMYSTEEKPEIMLVIKGHVKRYFILNNGSLGVQIVYGPQDMFSLTKMFELLLGQNIYDGPEVYYYQTMSDTEIFSLSADTFTEAVGQDPLLYKELLSEAGHHLKTCVHSIENISLGNSYARVAHQLLFYAREFGVETPKGITLGLPLTHQDIADILGTTRETVTMAIIRLRKEGIISDSRQFKVLNVKALKQAAYN